MTERTKANLLKLYQIIWCEACYDPTNEETEKLADKLLPFIRDLNDELHFKQ